MKARTLKSTANDSADSTLPSPTTWVLY